MKVLKLILVILLISLVLPLDIVSAGNTQNVTVSCTIPLVPGLNAPLATEQTISVASTEVASGAEEIAAVEEADEPEVIQQESTSGNMTLYTFCAK